MPSADAIGDDLRVAAYALASSEGWPLPVLCFATDSTNDDAKRGAARGAQHGSLWIAETQRAGRGRMGRTWVAGAGTSILCSLLLRPTSGLDNAPLLGMGCAIAICRGIEWVTEGRLRPRVKWPNDVVVVGADGSLRKLAGILVEAVWNGDRADIVVGFGLNVRADTARAAAVPNAASIDEWAPGIDRGTLLSRVLREIRTCSEGVLANGLSECSTELAMLDALSGRRVRCVQGKGRAVRVEANGALSVALEDGRTVQCNAGEVELIDGALAPLPPSAAPTGCGAEPEGKRA